MATNDPSRQLLQCTVRIDTAAGGGTGFITGRRKGDDLAPFLVTSRHVVARADRMMLAFLTKSDGQNPGRPKKVLVDVPDIQHHCVFHEDPKVDIAVIPFGGIASEYSNRGTPLRFKAIPADMYLSESKSHEMSAIEEIIVIGYPRLLRDEHTLTPIVRKGITATAIDQDFQALRGFLIDAAIFEGSSGSPVFIYNVGSYPTPTGIRIGRRAVFLGILAKLVSGLEYSPEANQTSIGAPPSLGGAHDAGCASLGMAKYTNLGLVFSAQCVHEAIARMMAEGGA